MAGLAEGGRAAASATARPSLARQRAGKTASRRTGPRRDAGDGAPDPVTAGFWQEAGGAVRLHAGARRDDLPGVAHRAGPRPPHRGAATLDRGGGQARERLERVMSTAVRPFAPAAPPAAG